MISSLSAPGRKLKFVNLLRLGISPKSGKPVTYLLLSRLNSTGEKSGYIDGVSKDVAALLSSRLGGAFGYYKHFLNIKNTNRIILAIWISFARPITTYIAKVII